LYKRKKVWHLKYVHKGEMLKTSVSITRLLKEAPG